MHCSAAAWSTSMIVTTYYSVVLGCKNISSLTLSGYLPNGRAAKMEYCIKLFLRARSPKALHGAASTVPLPSCLQDKMESATVAERSACSVTESLHPRQIWNMRTNVAE